MAGRLRPRLIRQGHGLAWRANCAALHASRDQMVGMGSSDPESASGCPPLHDTIRCVWGGAMQRIAAGLHGLAQRDSDRRG